MKKQERVCVTGAGGFLASWVVKYLLDKGYIVNGTVRDPNGCEEEIANNAWNLVDVVEAVILAYEKPEAQGRYICLAYVIKIQDLIDKLKSMFSNYNYPKNINETAEENHWRVMNCEKLQKLGCNYWPLEESLAESVKSYRENGIVN